MAKQPDRNGPGVPQAAAQARLKAVYISGSDLRWVIGKNSKYIDGEGNECVGEVLGLGILQPPPNTKGFEPGFVQVHVIYENYKDVFVLADHLVVKTLHVSEILVPEGPKLVVPA